MHHIFTSTKRLPMKTLFVIFMLICMWLLLKIYSKQSSLVVLSNSNNPCGPKSPYEDYYDEKYFQWQLNHQLFQAKHSDPTRFGRIKPEFNVLEIGCSAGAVLNTIRSARKFCVEINARARAYASEKYNLITFPCVGLLEDNSIDYAYTVSVLEHVEAPLHILREAYRKMKKGAVLEVQIKNEGYQSASEMQDTQKWSHKKHDIHNHIYTWTELLLGNMITAAGFEVESIASRIGAYPQDYLNKSEGLTVKEWHELVRKEGIRQGAVNLLAFARKI